MKKKAEKTGLEVRFKLKAEHGSRVFVAGTFNNWNASSAPLKESAQGGHFKTVLSLHPGRYEYKFFVNGTWCLDPKCPDFVLRDDGTLNSVIEVRPHGHAVPTGGSCEMMPPVA